MKDAVFELDGKETREVFDLMKREADYAFWTRNPVKAWPLYDRLASFLGENPLAVHMEALALMREEESLDE